MSDVFGRERTIVVTFRGDDDMAARLVTSMRTAALALLDPSEDNVSALFYLGAAAVAANAKPLAVSSSAVSAPEKERT